MIRVFCFARKINKDITSAKKYGEIVHLTGFRPSLWSDEYADFIVDWLERKKFDADKDYILIIGDQISLCKVTTEVHSVHLGTVL